VGKVLTPFFQGKTPGKKAGKTRSFREIAVMQKGRGQAGGGEAKRVSRKPYNLDQSCFKPCNALR